MACSCNSNPCYCLPRCPEDCDEVIEKSAANINLAGVGMYDSESNDQFQFRGVASGDSYIVVTHNSTNKTAEITINTDTISGGIPDATETVEGKVELATQAEVNAGTDAVRVVTPATFAGRTSTETRAGIIELATQAETTTGTDATRAVTPINLKVVTDSLKKTVTFADAVARAAATPAFDGQMGVQLDTEQFFSATGTSAGNWTAHPSLTATTGNDVTGVFEFESGAILDMKSGSIIKDNGVTVPASSVLTTSSTAGELNSMLISAFVSTANTQTGWTAPTGTLARATYATYTSPNISGTYVEAEVQAIADALQVVSRTLGALITDLLLVKLPAN